MSQFSNEEIQEFTNEAMDLLDEAEAGLLAIESGEEFAHYFDSIFRSLHNIKGSAGMLELVKLQSHVHLLESRLTELKSQSSLTKEQIDFFLVGIDGARKILSKNDTKMMTEVHDSNQISGKSISLPPTHSAPEVPPAHPSDFVEVCLVGYSKNELNAWTQDLNLAGVRSQPFSDGGPLLKCYLCLVAPDAMRLAEISPPLLEFEVQMVLPYFLQNSKAISKLILARPKSKGPAPSVSLTEMLVSHFATCQSELSHLQTSLRSLVIKENGEAS